MNRENVSAGTVKNRTDRDPPGEHPMQPAVTASLVAALMAVALGVTFFTRDIAAPVACPQQWQFTARHELVFGLSKPDGTPVSTAEWSAFVDTVITPALPDGFSVVEAQGQWRDPRSGRIVQEPSRVLLVWAPLSPEMSSKLDTIRTEYRRRFQQESVLAAQAPACVQF